MTVLPIFSRLKTYPGALVCTFEWFHELKENEARKNTGEKSLDGEKRLSLRSELLEKAKQVVLIL